MHVACTCMYILYICVLYVRMYVYECLYACVWGGTGDWVRYGGGGECRGCLRLRYVVMCVRVHVPVCFYMRVGIIPATPDPRSINVRHTLFPTFIFTNIGSEISVDTRGSFQLRT